MHGSGGESDSDDDSNDAAVGGDGRDLVYNVFRVMEQLDMIAENSPLPAPESLEGSDSPIAAKSSNSSRGTAASHTQGESTVPTAETNTDPAASVSRSKDGRPNVLGSTHAGLAFWTRGAPGAAGDVPTTGADAGRDRHTNNASVKHPSNDGHGFGTSSGRSQGRSSRRSSGSGMVSTSSRDSRRRSSGHSTGFYRDAGHGGDDHYQTLTATLPDLGMRLPSQWMSGVGISPHGSLVSPPPATPPALATSGRFSHSSGTGGGGGGGGANKGGVGVSSSGGGMNGGGGGGGSGAGCDALVLQGVEQTMACGTFVYPFVAACELRLLQRSGSDQTP